MRPGESAGLVTEIEGCSDRTATDVDEDKAVHNDKRESISMKEGVSVLVIMFAYRADCEGNRTKSRGRKRRGKEVFIALK